MIGREVVVVELLLLLHEEEVKPTSSDHEAVDHSALDTDPVHARQTDASHRAPSVEDEGDAVAEVVVGLAVAAEVQDDAARGYGDRKDHATPSRDRPKRIREERDEDGRLPWGRGAYATRSDDFRRERRAVGGRLGRDRATCDHLCSIAEEARASDSRWEDLSIQV